MSDFAERIAIVGVGGIFPGAPDPSMFWQNIARGIDAGRAVPDRRWYLSAKQALAPWPPQPDRVYSTWGCFIEGFEFNPEGLNLDPALLARLDPMFHLGLHAARAAFRDARELCGTDRTRVGVILGNIALPTESTSAICRDVLGRTFVEKLIDTAATAGANQDSRVSPARIAELKSSIPRSNWHSLNHFAAGLPASLISQGLGLGGIAFTLDAACASSLYSLKLASEELLAHRADAMLAGGMSRPDCQYTQMGFAQLQALSRRGRCAPLSAAADGLVVGEGAGVFVLKRLSDAVAANDHIYGVIAGVGLSNDRGANLLAPHSEGQLRAMRAAYQQAGWKPSDVDLIECHATGTPVGDAVEIASLHQLWEFESYSPRQCTIGCVKSNVGHLLTGAGAAGLMKVLYALRNQTLPPTANFTEPAAGLASSDSPFQVLAASQPWQRRSPDVPRRATINAFGFGGINAHVLIEEWDAALTGQRRLDAADLNRSAASPKIAIVGIDAHFGGSAARHSHVTSEPSDDAGEWLPLNWWGVEQTEWYRHEASHAATNCHSRAGGNPANPVGPAITEVRIPMGQFRIPPLETQDMLPQQQLMLKVAAGALQDAALPHQSDKTVPDHDYGLRNASDRTGVFVGIELDPNTTNFHFRWAIEQDARHWAEMLGLELSAEELADWVRQLKDAAGPPLTANRVMGNLGGIVASRLAREFDVGGPSFTISCGGDSGRLAFETAARFLERGELDAAIVGGVDFASDVRLSVHREPQGHSQGISPGRDGAIGFVLRRRDDAMSRGDRIYATRSQDVLTDNSFHATRATWAMESLLHSAQSAYYRREGLMPRLRNRADSTAAHGNSGEASHLASEDQPITGLIAQERFGSEHRSHIGLFAISGASSAEFLAALQELARIETSTEFEQVAQRWRQVRSYRAEDDYLAAIVATSCNELTQSIDALKQWASEGRTTAPAIRHAFVSTTRTQRGQLAFVFPGSGSGFPLMGRDLLAAFPDVLDRQDRENQHLKRQYVPEMIWSREAFPELIRDHKALIFTQVAIGTAICDLLANCGIVPSASIGYSLGETAALFGLRAWPDRDEMLERLQRSTLFGSDLVAPFDAARREWNISSDRPVPWISGVIDRSESDVRNAIRSLPRVYLLIINTSRQCVVGGEHEQVERLVRTLNATFIPFPSPSTVHCAALRHVEEDYRQLHLMRTVVPMSQRSEPIRFYSTAWGRSYALTRESAAEAIVAQAVETIDFPQVIRRAYDDGVRLFVEIGPGSSCTRMIDDILAERPHLARAALPVTSLPLVAFYELLATLIVERVPVDLSYVCGLTATPVHSKPVAREIVTRVGGLPFQIPAPASGWRFAIPFPDKAAESTRESLQEMAKFSVGPTETNWTLSPTVHELSEPEADFTPERPVAVQTSSTWNAVPLPSSTVPSTPLMDQFQLMMDQRTQAHEAFLRFSATLEHLAAEQLALLAQVTAETEARLATSTIAPERIESANRATSGLAVESPFAPVNKPHVAPFPEYPEQPPTSLNREQCMEFAIGKIGRVLGKKFAEIDQHPTRVRLPDEPLMLVDRILTIEGEPLSMTSGRVVTEHDVHPGAWYLDCGRIPTAIAVESGQADLFLSGWLGIDLQTKGLACYRLLDAVVTFHDSLPQAGKTINYDIRVLHFFRQGNTYLFRFEFDATVDGHPLLTMREGCAGFFTDEELAGGKGIIHTALDKRPRPGIRPADWSDPVPMAVEQYDDSQILALRRGDLATCFGPAFDGLPVTNPVTIPGLSPETGRRTRMWLVDRVLKLDPAGGKFALGSILGELDIHPDDWFLTCHFCDDQVMPGTLMYECCMHTLRIYLLRMGWIGEAGQIAYEPIPGVRSRLKCRGQVLASTKKVWYEVTLKEVGYGKDGTDSFAYCLADALMYADGKPIVEITDMCGRLTGLTRERVLQIWSRRPQTSPRNLPSPTYDRRPALFDTDRITAFAIGKPSDAFGDKYKVFDEERKIARLPGPPFQFLDRIVSITGCEPWVLKAGGEIVAQYDVPVGAWYFESNRQPTMPFAVLLETALQPCGWLAAYVGSALTSDTDISFRNLGGTATQYRPVTAGSGTLTTTVKMTRVSNSAGMIIQHYDFDLRCQGESVYTGNTYFGFFSKAALANQIGLRDAAVYQPTAAEKSQAESGPYPSAAPFSDDQFRMISQIEFLSLTGGPHGHGAVIGTLPVDPSAWFFKAHFYQDPVVPGSLGLESFWQLVKVYAAKRWRLGSDARFATPSLAPGSNSSKPMPHEWVYRGQVIPRDHLVTVTAVVKYVDDAKRQVTTEGFLSIDGRVIYQMKNFSLAVE